MNETAYGAFQEGTRLLADANAHAAVVALERARELEPDKGSVRETLARAYYRAGASRGRREFAPRSISSRSTTTRTTGWACAACGAATTRRPAATCGWRSRCGPTTTTTAPRSPASPTDDDVTDQ